MKIWQLLGTEGSASLQTATAEVERPRRRQVLVRVHAVSLNFRDVAITRGNYPGVIPAGVIPTSDAAGEVVEVGEDVACFRSGERVTGLFAQGWLAGRIPAYATLRMRGSARPGTLAEYVVFEEEDLVATPAYLTHEEAACTPCAGVTAWNAIYGGQHGLQAGESVLVQGTGGVAVFALQLARAAGARVVLTSSSDRKLDALAPQGAWRAINYRSQPEWQDEVRRVTDDVGVDLTVEIGGPGTLARSVQATRFGGTIGILGVLTRGQVDPLTLMHRGITLRCILAGSREMHAALFRCMQTHQLHPIIDRVFPFAEARAAFDRIESGAHLGKVVISVAP
jgi:NADPH:quinone reductase-like Zn-dependent oxidoreductase